MAIFRLEGDTLIPAPETNIEFEEHLETWLENSPRQVLAREDFLWIGRQASASDEDGTIFPDLLGVDSKGNLIIVELKKNQAPRDVIAQLLEYASWAYELSDAQIYEIAEAYFEDREGFQGRAFDDVFKEIFDISETDEIPPLNQKLRLFIVAKEIPTRVARVCRFLRTSHGMDIICIDVSTFQTESGEKLVSMETKVGDEDVITSKAQRQPNSQTSRWSGDKPVNQVVWEAVQELTTRDPNLEFTLKEVRRLILEKYSDFNPSTADFQLYSDCVNHPSRHHYPGGSDRYWRVGYGRYRLYDSENDKVEGDGEVNREKQATENLT